METSAAGPSDFFFLDRRLLIGVSFVPGVDVGPGPVIGVALADCFSAGVELVDSGCSLSSGWTILNLSAPYLASISSEASCRFGAWFAKMLNCSADKVAGSTPFPFRRFMAVCLRRSASSSGTFKIDVRCRPLRSAFCDSAFSSRFAISPSIGVPIGASGALPLDFL
ncbi:hypothetical protein F4819DRAFT_397287 [Hypoxylon fuscum]|nr:hypothetical protein F4819DRAFT_397287 [Hypoxylon fuscum]